MSRLIARAGGAAALVLLGCLFRPAAVTAQQHDAHHPPAAQADTGASGMEAMLPMMAHMFALNAHAMLDVAAEPQTAEKLATFTKNYFDALLKRGFSRDEAIRIVSAASLPGTSGMR